MNILQLLNSNPKQIISNCLGNSPVSNNLINLVEKKDQKGIEQMARNLAKEKGMNPDELYNKVKSRLGL